MSCKDPFHDPKSVSRLMYDVCPSCKWYDLKGSLKLTIGKEVIKPIEDVRIDVGPGLNEEMIMKSLERIAKKGMADPTPTISFQAHQILQQIYKLKPNFRFGTETEIWIKAKELGLIG